MTPMVPDTSTETSIDETLTAKGIFITFESIYEIENVEIFFLVNDFLFARNSDMKTWVKRL